MNWTFAAAVTVGLFMAVARPLADHVQVFPYTSSGDWAGARTLWTVAAVAALAVLWAALGGLSSARLPRRPARLARR